MKEVKLYRMYAYGHNDPNDFSQFITYVRCGTLQECKDEFISWLNAYHEHNTRGDYHNDFQEASKFLNAEEETFTMDKYETMHEFVIEYLTTIETYPKQKDCDHEFIPIYNQNWTSLDIELCKKCDAIKHK